MDAKDEQRQALERQVRAYLDTDDTSAAATALIEGFGGEILSFLHGMLRSPDEAGEAFQLFSEQMWMSLARFRGDSSLRTWCYTIARRSAHRILRDPNRRAERAVPLSQSPQLKDMADRVRTITLRFLRTEAKNNISSLRDQLGEQERTLLILRIDRGLSWVEIAGILSESELDEPGLKADATKLRKRFTRAKERLRTLAEQAGMLAQE